MKYWLSILALAGLFFAGAAQAASFKVTVTAPTPLDELDLQRVVFVTVDCAPELDCADIERRALVEVQKLEAPFTVVPEAKVRALLFEQGLTSYDPELRAELAEALEVDAFFEIEVPFSEKGSGPFMGNKSSRATVELTVVTPDGKILLHGVGAGRPKNVVSSPERVAGNVIERILAEALE